MTANQIVQTDITPEFDISSLNEEHFILKFPRKFIETEISLWEEFANRVRRGSSSPTFNVEVLARYESVFSAHETFYMSLKKLPDHQLAQPLINSLHQSNIVALRGQFGATARRLFNSAPIPVLQALEANTSTQWLKAPNEVERANKAAELQLIASHALDSLPRAIGRQDHYLTDIGKQYDALVKRMEGTESAAREQNQTNSKKLEDWIATQRAEIDALHAIYHTKLGIEAPANFWEKKASEASKSSNNFYQLFLALVAFGLAVTILAGWQLWPELKSLTQSNFSFPFSLIATLLVPVLGYAWVLKQVSRLFLTNRAIADDASYRHVMTMTYLGLAKDPNSGITKEERGLILNALFRPAPASTQDDGPPMGVFDLINGKKP